MFGPDFFILQSGLREKFVLSLDGLFSLHPSQSSMTLKVGSKRNAFPMPGDAPTSGTISRNFHAKLTQSDSQAIGFIPGRKLR